jgi:hypothetical protein
VPLSDCFICGGDGKIRVYDSLWDSELHWLQFAFNSAHHESVKLAPNSLMLAFAPHNPLSNVRLLLGKHGIGDGVTSRMLMSTFVSTMIAGDDLTTIL